MGRKRRRKEEREKERREKGNKTTHAKLDINLMTLANFSLPDMLLPSDDFCGSWPRCFNTAWATSSTPLHSCSNCASKCIKYSSRCSAAKKSSRRKGPFSTDVLVTTFWTHSSTWTNFTTTAPADRMAKSSSLCSSATFCFSNFLLRRSNIAVK